MWCLSNNVRFWRNKFQWKTTFNGNVIFNYDYLWGLLYNVRFWENKFQWISGLGFGSSLKYPLDKQLSSPVILTFTIYSLFFWRPWEETWLETNRNQVPACSTTRYHRLHAAKINVNIEPIKLRYHYHSCYVHLIHFVLYQ